MKITVNVGEELQELLKLAYAAKRAVMLLGHTGVGKSESIEESAKQLGIDYICRDLSLMDGPDLTGIPREKDGRTVYAVPSFLPKEKTNGLLCFEELNRAPRYTRAPCLQLLTARRLNDYVLPDGWLPVAAVNPGEDDDYCDVDELDKALLARFMVVDVVPDVRNWLAWATKNNVHPAVIAFVKGTPEIFEKPKSNPRSWKYVSDVLKTHEQKNVAESVLFAAVYGYVEKLAQGFLSFYSKKGALEVPSPEQILNAYSTVKATVLELAKNRDTANLDSLVYQMLVHLQNPADEQKVKSNSVATGNLKSLIADLPAEFAKKIRKDAKWINKK